jgi:MFS family permease
MLRSDPAAARVMLSSLLARLPLPMAGIVLLVHAHARTGSFSTAGLVTAAYAVAAGAGGPGLGRLVDRRGQTAVLVGSALTAALLLGAFAAVPAPAPWVLVALAAGIGLATPPAGACARALLPSLWRDAGAARRAYAIDATAVELTWVAGPPLALGCAAVLSTGAAVLIVAAIVLVGTLAFAAQPASRRRRPAPAGAGLPRGRALASPGLRTLVGALLAVGVLFGGVEVAVTAQATHLDHGAAGGALLGLWGLGSLLGGALATRLGGSATTGAGLTRLLALLAAGHLALPFAASGLVPLAAVLLVAGAAIAPTYAAVYAIAGRVAPAGTATEAFAWLATAAAVGSAAGNALAGALAEHGGATTAFLVAAGAAVVATAITGARAGTLGERAARRHPDRTMRAARGAATIVGLVTGRAHP